MEARADDSLPESPTVLASLISASGVGHVASSALRRLVHQAAQWPTGLALEPASLVQSCSRFALIEVSL
jgi:hypothetical protein